MSDASHQQLKNRIQEFLARYPKELFKPAVLARRLSIKGKQEQHLLQQSLNEMSQAGLISRVRRTRYGHAPAPVSQRMSGILRTIRKGGGIVEIDDPAPAKIAIRQGFLGTAMSGDRVSVSVFAHTPARPGQDQAGAEVELPEGEIVEIISRSERPIIGTFQKGRNFFFVIPDRPNAGRDIYIPDGKTMGARPGEKVCIKIQAWDSPNLNPEGEVTTVFGKAGEVRVEMRAIAEEFRLPKAFPADVISQTEKIPDEIPREDYRNRLDLRSIPCFAIDPEDAKDHDDAVSVVELKNGLLEVGVHIADVSHYVTEGSALDREALKRGTSIYLPGSVVPMLPERLSADICSLLPGVDRLTYSVLFQFTPEGEIRQHQIQKSVIHCQKGFTYEEVQRILDSGRGPNHKELRTLHALTKVLLAKRLREGSIDFDSPEVSFRFDPHGMPSEIVKRERLDSHRLVEDLMLLANQTVAGEVGRTRKGTTIKPFIYRVHDAPDPERLRDFAFFVKHIGYSFSADGGVTSKSFQRLLESVRGKEEENVVNELAIRTMAKATYSPENIGHFGLAFKYYSHFTSPIRRYPDLMVHRLLEEYSNTSKKPRIQKWEAALPDICTTSSARERLAQEAERASVKVMQVEYMKRHVGDIFHAIISGVTNFGVFVQINQLLVEGLIRMRDLEDDYYVFDQKHFQLVGRRTKRKYRLGDKVVVKVVRVDPEEQEIDFGLVEEARRGRS